MAMMKSFGQNPRKSKLSSISNSVNYKKGGFENLSNTPLMVGDESFLKNLWSFLNKPSNTTPSVTLPSVKSDLTQASEHGCSIFWFGHSSYLIKVGKRNFLIDPVFGGHASPFLIGARSFNGTDTYTVDDMPEIDVLIITHDQYDHLDHRSLVKLKPKIKSICTSLGVGSHLEYWGYEREKITELDWWQSNDFGDNVKITAAPARHFSGRTFKRGQTLWSSFSLEASAYKLYIGSDSGYDSHFKDIGEKLGPFNLVMLETGQYDIKWPFIHMMPEETIQATIDLKADILLPVHWGKFSLAFHPWYEPVERAIVKANELKVKITTPMIGEPVILNTSYPTRKWWEDYKK